MTTTPKYKRLDPAQRREQMLDAANDLFAERGYEEVSVEDIASSAGVTRGLVHHYFGGRKEGYIALLERLGTMREEQLPPPAGRSARARVADSVSRWLDWTEQNRTIWLATLGRGEDIADLARSFLARFAAEEGKRLRGFSAEALALLVRYDWPGNVRQLENALFRAVVLADGDEIQIGKFRLSYLER